MLDIINLALPFFGLIFIGFACGKLRQIPDAGLAWMNFFILYVALPALFLHGGHPKEKDDASVIEARNKDEGKRAYLQFGMVVVDRDMRVVVWNRGCEELWGLRSDETVGTVLTSLDIGLPTDEMKPLIGKALGGKGSRWRCDMRHCCFTPLLLVVVSLALFPGRASAHPGSGIVVDENGNVFIADINLSWSIPTSRTSTARTGCRGFGRSAGTGALIQREWQILLRTHR